MKTLNNANVAKLVLVITVLVSVFLGARIGIGNRYDQVMDVWYNGIDGDGACCAKWMDERVDAAYNVVLLLRTSSKHVEGLDTQADLVTKMQNTDDPAELLHYSTQATAAMAQVRQQLDTVLTGNDLVNAQAQSERFSARGDIIAHDDYRVLANEYNQLLKKFPANLLWQLVGLERAPV